MLDIKALSRNINDEVISIRRHIHKYPELSFQEYETSKYVEEKLNSFGIMTKRVGKTGLIGILEGVNSGPVVGLRADMDALEVEEKTGFAYASSKKGMMHACGHDSHIAMLICAAKILSHLKKEINGTVKFIFQAAEEADQGALAFINAGECDDLEAIFCLHVTPDLYAGEASIEPGAIMAGSNNFNIRLIGKGGHGANPHLGIDTLLAGSALVMNLQSIVSREYNPEDPLVVTVGSFHAGTAFNVLAEEAKLSGTIRTFNQTVLNDIRGTLERIVNNTAETYRVKPEIEYMLGVPVLENDTNLVKIVRSAAKQIFDQSQIVKLPRTMVGEDFAFYKDKCPVTMAWLGIGHKNEQNYSLHHPKFKINEDALWRGVGLHVQTALEFLSTI